MSGRLTVEEWLAEMAAMTKRDDPGMTSQEMAERSGVSQRILGDRLRAAKRMGWLRLGWRSEEATDGRVVRRPVYRIEKPDA